MHKEQKNIEKVNLSIGEHYKVSCDVADNPFQELDFIIEGDSRDIHFNVKILKEYDNFFLARALRDEYIVKPINVTISKSHLITGTVVMKELN